MHRIVLCIALALSLAGSPLVAADPRPFEPMDVFELERATDPRVSPDGSRIAFLRAGFDVMTDRATSELWIVDSDGSSLRPLVTDDVSSPRWSPDGTRLAYVAPDEHGNGQIHVLWLDSGRTARLTRVTESPGNLAWSPNGDRLAFSMLVPGQDEPLAHMPKPPKGADWAPPPRVIDELQYRVDGAGYLPEGHRHLFVVPAAGGTPRQVTSGDFDHPNAPSWTADGQALVFSANREDDHELDPLDTELYEVRLEDGSISALTDRQGPDDDPAVSPDGRYVAYLGFDDRYQGYQVTRLYVLDRETGTTQSLTDDLDRSVDDPLWSGDGRSLYVSYTDRGEGYVARVGLDGTTETVASNVGGSSLGRPYTSGSFSVSRNGVVAFTHGGPYHPADLGAAQAGEPGKRILRFNEDLLDQVELGRVEEIRYPSSHDDREIQGWIVHPPGFDPEREEKYPLLLEIHGGPFASYGPYFAAEIQLYAAAGYVVLYTNPRGSTSYGEEFGNLIHHAYPSHDYDDLMSGVDAAVAKGYVDPERLYVTGGSGGGVLTAWIVGHTDRFRAAAVQKPVIDWASFVLTADLASFFVNYWFPGPPWEHWEHYRERSPLTYVGAVTTPTMVITGEQDYRTPMSESEQWYQALKLRGVDSVLVRIPEASHGIARRPSHLIAKVAHVLGWFGRYGRYGEGLAKAETEP